MLQSSTTPANLQRPRGATAAHPYALKNSPFLPVQSTKMTRMIGIQILVEEEAARAHSQLPPNGRSVDDDPLRRHHLGARAARHDRLSPPVIGKTLLGAAALPREGGACPTSVDMPNNAALGGSAADAAQCVVLRTLSLVSLPPLEVRRRRSGPPRRLV